MIVFSDGGNTLSPALLTIAGRGYLVSVECGAEGDLAWVATKDEVKVEARSPQALLGMVVLLESPRAALR